MSTATITNQASFKLEEKDLKRFNSLMEETYKKVYNMAYRLSGSRPDAEDLTQEAYYRAYRSFGDYEGDRPFENWIFRIVTRLYLDLLRNRRRRVSTVSYDNTLPTDFGSDAVRFEVADDRPNPEEELLFSEFSDEMVKALSSLTEEQRELIRMADVEQIPYNEIAEKLGRPVGTIRSRLHRTHKQLRREIETIRLREQDLREPVRA